MNPEESLPLLAANPGASVDLAAVALGLARDEYPALDVEACLGELAGMAHDARAFLGGGLEERTRGLCRFLFHDMGFRGNVADYYDPANSYLNEVLEHRCGLPITLTLVAMAVGARAGLPIVPVGLPGHLVAKAVEHGGAVLFDPFHGGRLLTPEECGVLVEQVTGQPFQVTRESLEPLQPGPFVLRMLCNLKTAYLRREDFGRCARVIERIRLLLPDDPTQRRDLGVCLVHAGQPGKALDHLQAYLDARPFAGDADEVRQVMEGAKGELTSWN